MERWNMSTGTICQYLWWMENGPLFSILSAPVFSTTLDDISLISHVLHICGKLVHQTLLAPVRQTKGGAWCLTDRWVTRTGMREKTNQRRWCERNEESRKEWRMRKASDWWIPRGEAVSVNLGANSCQSVPAPSEASRRLIKFKWKWSLAAQVDR